MSAMGSVDLIPVTALSDPDECRDFLRLLKREAENEPLDQSEVSSFGISDLDDSDRWMELEFNARGATYRIGGQLLSPDLLSPRDAVLSFLGRIAFSSAAFNGAPLGDTNARDAFGIVKPVLRALARRVAVEVQRRRLIS